MTETNVFSLAEDISNAKAFGRLATACLAVDVKNKIRGRKVADTGDVLMLSDVREKAQEKLKVVRESEEKKRNKKRAAESKHEELKAEVAAEKRQVEEMCAKIEQLQIRRQEAKRLLEEKRAIYMYCTCKTEDAMLEMVGCGGDELKSPVAGWFHVAYIRLTARMLAKAKDQNEE